MRRERDWSVGPWSKGDRAEEYKAYVMLCSLPMRLLVACGFVEVVIWRAAAPPGGQAASNPKDPTP